MNLRTLLIALSVSTIASLAASAQPGPAHGGFAVVELFTSEGCSSCPPADEALARLSAQARAQGLPVVALEWHVDYWDSLGWKDPFASRLATERQYAYSRALPSDVYTPQVVMNGRLVPSWAGDLAEMERDARTLAAAAAPATLRLQVRRSAQAATLHISAAATGGATGSQVLVALVEDDLGGRPTAGENARRTLTHSSVVRSVVMLPGAGGNADLAVPAGVDLERASVVGLLQEPSMLIVAADRFDAGNRGAGAADGAGGRISGRLLDSRGQPAAGVIVQACSGLVCVPAVTRPDGSFTFPSLRPGTWSIAAGPQTKPVDVSLSEGQSVEVPLTVP